MDTKQIIQLSVVIILAVFIMKTMNKNKRDREEQFENFTNNEDFTVSSDDSDTEDNPEPENDTRVSEGSSSSEDNPEPEGNNPETSGVVLSTAALACGEKQTVIMDYDPNNHQKNKENITTILTTVIEKISKDEKEKTENKKKIITLLDLFIDAVYTDCEFLKQNYHDTSDIRELCTHLFNAYAIVFQNPDSFKMSMKCGHDASKTGGMCMQAIPESTDVNELTEYGKKAKDAKDIIKLLQQNSSFAINMEEKEIKLPEKNGEQVPGCYVLEKTEMNATCDINGKDEWFALMTKEDIDADPLMAEKTCKRKYDEKVKSCGLKNPKKVMVRTKKQKKAIRDFKTADISWEDAKINYKKKLIEKTTVPGCYVFHPDAECEPIVKNWELSKNNDDIKNVADAKVSREKCKKEIVHHSKVCNEKKLRKRREEKVCKDYRTNKDNVLAKGINFVTSFGKSIQTEAKLKEYCNEKFDTVKFYESKYIKTSQQRKLEEDKIKEMDKSIKAKTKKKIKEDGTVLGFVKGLWRKSTTKQKLMAGGGLLVFIIILFIIIFGRSGKSLEKRLEADKEATEKLNTN